MEFYVFSIDCKLNLGLETIGNLGNLGVSGGVGSGGGGGGSQLPRKSGLRGILVVQDIWAKGEAGGQKGCHLVGCVDFSG